MIIVRYAVCSERDNKPVTRAVCDSKADAERELQRTRERDGEAATTYWVAELGPECEAWRHLARERQSEALMRHHYHQGHGGSEKITTLLLIRIEY